MSDTNSEGQVLQCLQEGDFLQAEKIARSLLNEGKDTAKLWFYLGVCFDVQGRSAEALDAFERALQINSDEVLAWSAKSSVLSKLKRYEEALLAAKQASALNPKSSLLLANVGVAYQQVAESELSPELYEDAFNAYQQAISLNSTEQSALINISAISLKLNNPGIAMQQCLYADSVLSDNFDILNNLTEAYIQLFEFEKALSSCLRGLAIQPESAILNFKLVLIYACLMRHQDAALTINTLYKLDASRLLNFKIYLSEPQMVKFGELASRMIYLNLTFTQQLSCYWANRVKFVSNFIDFTLNLNSQLSTQSVGDAMFEMIALPINAQQRLSIARNITNINALAMQKLPTYKQSHNRRHQRIRVGYVSPDFKAHAVGFLTKKMFGLHDLSQFEIFAYSLTNTRDEITQSFENSFENFYDVSHLSGEDIARKIIKNEIDILVDLAGYTAYAKSEVFALRPAPVQVAYLGYPGTSGAAFIDYAMIDSTVVGSEKDWSESVIKLPNSYCPFDNGADNSEINKKRAEFNLQEDAIVLCCFNSNYKIEPTIFACWMRVLKVVPNSVLWLVMTHIDTPKHLYAEAIKFGIESERIIFASTIPHADHIKRYQLADLFIDTYWHNAHTTAIDALWQGLPVITCMGEVPSSRLAASLLNALEMPELVTCSLDDYEKTIIYYATHQQERLAMRGKLKAKRYTAPLFNMQLTVKHIESAYQQIWQRYCNGLPPANIRVIETNQVKPVTWRDIALF